MSRSETVARFADWLSEQQVTTCRLVQYDGPDHFATDVPAPQAPGEVGGLVDEGFSVDWAVHEGTVYLKVWEHGRGEPPWTAVFAERDLADR